MTLYLLKVHLQTFLSIPITQKCQILSCDPLAAKERYINISYEKGYEVLSDLHGRQTVYIEPIWFNIKLTEKFIVVLSATKYQIQSKTANITDETRDWPLLSKCDLYTA